MPDISFNTEVTTDVELNCSCGNSLSGRAKYSGKTPWLEVKPCERCLARAKDDGESEGYERGVIAGREAGQLETLDAQ